MKLAARPMRTVTESYWRSGRGSLLGGDTSRRVRWWELQLECGHTVQRFLRYTKQDRPNRSGGWTSREIDDALPPPRHVHCDYCT